jgi:hypothetical protein
MTERFNPCWSAKRPDGNAKNTCVNANKASNAPTITAL